MGAIAAEAEAAAAVVEAVEAVAAVVEAVEAVAAVVEAVAAVVEAVAAGLVGVAPAGAARSKGLPFVRAPFFSALHVADRWDAIMNVRVITGRPILATRSARGTRRLQVRTVRTRYCWTAICPRRGSALRTAP